MDPSFCANRCGFYGSEQTLNFCSKCYKDYLLESVREITTSQGQVPTATSFPATLTDQTSSTRAQTSSPASASQTTTTVDSSSGGGTKRARCSTCNTRVGALGFSCRCGDVFCGVHRYPEKHACRVDLKALGRQVLAEQMPLVRSDKLEYRI